ncbi:MAG TPA: NADP-dependent oxidoreductase [Polyangiales bacterium]|nr:NADP-dependent oxidoreductase [Polyangiales bacterium]
MKSIRVHRFGGPDVLQLETLPLPALHGDELLIRVHAASVNPVDFKTREGKFLMIRASDLPLTLGRDVSGVVENSGASGNYFNRGDAVYALLERDQGGYSQFTKIKSSLCALKPVNLTHVEAAAIPLAALTALQGLFVHGALKAKQRVLIHGGSGGVGHMAVQLAKAKGAHVSTTVGADKVEFARELGADEVIDYISQRFEDVVEPVDVVLDLIGGDTQQRSFKVLKRGGRLISTLQPPDEQALREHALSGLVFLTEPNAGQLAEIGRLVETGELRPHISATFPLEEAARAQQQLEREHSRGKIVLTA